MGKLTKEELEKLFDERDAFLYNGNKAYINSMDTELIGITKLKHNFHIVIHKTISILQESGKEDIYL